MVKGHLISQGIIVPRRRLRASLTRADVEGRAERRLTTINRRSYWCPSPNYVWHSDGTHKLVRWRFVVHVAVDGYSRLIAYCHCSDINKAKTVVDLFKNAEERYGLPLRVRTDFGVENVRVWEYMYEKRQNSNAVIVGSSVHNQRVERLHRDVNTQVVNYFYNEFTKLEDEGLLDPLNDTHLFCLHIVYLPIINQRLAQFRDAFNNHPMSTENNNTPLQLFRLNYRLLQFQCLDPSGDMNLSDIAQHSENNVSVPSIAHPPMPFLRLLHNIIHQNIQLDAFSLYCTCARSLLNAPSSQ